MKRFFYITIATLILSVGFSCKRDSRPNYQFMPNMYEPVPYETYGEYDIFVNEQEAKLPVEGSVPRGTYPMEYENSTEGYEDAKANLENPLDSVLLGDISTKGLYDIYCAICHGTRGDGQGELVKREKILGVPSYDDAGRAITVGSVYHVIYYGKNTMGSYANQLTETERWQVADYVMTLKKALEGSEEEDTEANNTTASAATETTETQTDSTQIANGDQ